MKVEGGFTTGIVRPHERGEPRQEAHQRRNCRKEHVTETGIIRKKQRLPDRGGCAGTGGQHIAHKFWDLKGSRRPDGAGVITNTIMGDT